MNAVQFDSKFTDQLERELISREISVFRLRKASRALAGSTPDAPGNTGYSKALAVLRGALIVSAVVFVTTTLALETAARFF